MSFKFTFWIIASLLSFIDQSGFKNILSSRPPYRGGGGGGASKSITQDDAMTQVYICSWTKAIHSLKYSSFVMLLETPAGMADEAISCSWNRTGLYCKSCIPNRESGKPCFDGKNERERRLGKEEDSLDERFAGMAGTTRSCTPGREAITER